jgi:subtilase family serine protease
MKSQSTAPVCYRAICYLLGKSRNPLSTAFPSRTAIVSILLLTGKLLFAETAVIAPNPLVAKSTFLTAADGNKELNVVLTLPLADPAGAADFVKHISTSGDALFHRYLTAEEFAARFGASSTDYTALKQWAAAKGLLVTKESKARTALTVHGTVAQFQEIFKTRINTYRSPKGQQFDSAESQLMVPSTISAKVAGVIGLTEGEQYHSLYKVAQTLGETGQETPARTKDGVTSAYGTGPGGTYSAADLRKAYSIPSFGSLDKKSVVALFEQGGFRESDVTKFLDWNSLPHHTVTPVSVDGAPITVSSDIEVEAVLDIDMVFAINPDVSQVLVYEDGVDSFPTALLDAMIQVGDDNKAQILSISYGQDEGYQGSSAIAAENDALIQLAAEGITVFASSGDSGAYGDGYNYPYNVADPASQPYITGVGGTTLLTGTDGAYEVESAWNDLGVGVGATGGGVSSYWRIPAFQSAEPEDGYCTFNGGSVNYRNVPDVSAVGDPFTGVGIYCKDEGGWLQLGGTSVSAPIWAGYLSIINSVYNWAGLNYVGYFNPALYDVNPFGIPAEYFFDVTQGSNGNTPDYGYPGYANGFGYSNTTGNGSPWGSGFLQYLLVARNQTGPWPGNIAKVKVGVKGTTASLSWTQSTLASGYIVTFFHPDEYGYYVANTYLTKATSLKVTGLLPNNDTYIVYLWGFNQNGGSDRVQLEIDTH